MFHVKFVGSLASLQLFLILGAMVFWSLGIHFSWFWVLAPVWSLLLIGAFFWGIVGAVASKIG